MRNDRRISVERQRCGTIGANKGGQMRARIALRQNRCNRHPRNTRFHAVCRLSHSNVFGHKHEIGTLGQRNDIRRRKRNILCADAPHRTHPLCRANIPMLVGVDRRDLVAVSMRTCRLLLGLHDSPFVFLSSYADCTCSSRDPHRPSQCTPPRAGGSQSPHESSAHPPPQTAQGHG